MVNLFLTILKKGVYFADMVSKSANYCYSTENNPTGLILMCDVSLGNMLECRTAQNITKLPDDKHSVFAKGRIFPDPTQIFKTDDELEIPLGTAVEIKNMKTDLIHNE